MKVKEVSKKDKKNRLNAEKYKFALVKAAERHPFFDPWDLAAVDVAADLKIPIPVVQAPKHWNQDEQNKVLDSLIARGINGIGMFPADANEGNIQITKMADSGIPVVSLGGSPNVPSKAEFCLATDVAASAYEGTKQIIKAFNGGGGNIVHLASMRSDPNIKKRILAVKKACDEVSNVELLETIVDIDALEPAQYIINDILETKMHKINGIICTGYIPSMVIAEELMNKKQTDIDIIIVGIDTDPAVLKAIREGYMYGTMSQNPYAQSYIGLASLKFLLDGYQWKSTSPFFVDSGSFFIDNSNVNNVDKVIIKKTKELFSNWKSEHFVSNNT